MKQTTLHRLRQQDRAELETLLIALNGAKKALRLDECGDRVITGSRGTIRACEGKFFIYLARKTSRIWNNTKDALSGIATATQDGDEEGILVMERMPSPEEAETLRKHLGLRQTRDVSEEQRQSFAEVRQKSP